MAGHTAIPALLICSRSITELQLRHMRGMGACCSNCLRRASQSHRIRLRNDQWTRPLISWSRPTEKQADSAKSDCSPEQLSEPGHIIKTNHLARASSRPEPWYEVLRAGLWRQSDDL